MLNIEGLARHLPSLKIDVPHLQIRQGELFALLGPTGSGKSSLLETLAGFAAAASGSIRIGNKEVANLAPEARGISIVFQGDTLFPHLSVRQNIQYGDSDDRRLAHMAKLLRIEPLLGRSTRRLSGGERQLVAIARALMVRPRLLLLDEPFSSIDREKRTLTIRAFQRVQRSLGMTCLMVTHNLDEALHLADRIGILMNGQIVQIGRPAEVLEEPATPEIAQFLGISNLFEGEFRRAEDAAEVPRGEPFLVVFQTANLKLHALGKHEGPGYAIVPPEDITLSNQRPGPSSALNQLEGLVRDIQPHAGLQMIVIDAGVPFRVLVTTQSCLALNLKAKERVFLSFKASAIRVL